MVDVIVLGNIITMDTNNTIIQGGAIAIDSKKIIDIGKSDVIKHNYTADIILGNDRSIIIPGIINSHTHLAMTLFRGLIEGLTGSDWLDLAWSIESNLSDKDVYYGTMLGIIQMIRSGTTCFIDHYYHMDQVALAVEKSGIRGALAETIMDFNNDQKGAELVDKGKKFVERWNGKAEGRIKCLMGPHSTVTCSPNTLRNINEMAQDLNVPVHIHLQENRDELLKIKNMWGERPIGLLEKLGLLNNNLLAAHVTFLSDDELNLLSKRQVNVATCVYGKMKGGQGIARIKEMLGLGINVSLATDGAATHNNLDMFEEMKFAIAAQSVKYKKPNAITAEQALKMATINGAKDIHMDNLFGSIEVGKDADLVIINGSSAKALPYHNYPSLVAQTFSGDDVTDVIIQGRIIMKDKKILTIDETDTLTNAENHFMELMNKSNIQPTEKSFLRITNSTKTV
ncbi:MAG: amidohydrolase [Caldisphaera sp.]